MIERRALLKFFTYALVGAVGTLAQYAVLVACVSLHWTSPATGSFLGAILGAVINYILNARFTFRSRTHASALPKFAATALLGAALNGLLMKLFTGVFGIYYLVAQLVATAIVLGLTYALNLVWTFRRNGNEAGT